MPSGDLAQILALCDILAANKYSPEPGLRGVSCQWLGGKICSRTYQVDAKAIGLKLVGPQTSYSEQPITRRRQAKVDGVAGFAWC